MVKFRIDSEVLECGPCADAVFGLVVAPSLRFEFAKDNGGWVFSGSAGGIPVCALGKFLPLDSSGSIAGSAEDSSVWGVVVVVEMPVPSSLADASCGGCFAARCLMIGISVAGAARG